LKVKRKKQWQKKKRPMAKLPDLNNHYFAVAATLSTFKGGGYSTQSMLSQE